MKRCSALLDKRESKLQGTPFTLGQNGHHFENLQINTGEDMEKREPSSTAGGNVSWCSHCANSIKVHQKTESRIIYDPAIHRLYIPRYTTSQGTRTPVFTAALFIRAETWKQPKHPSKDEGISQDVRYIHIYTRVCIHIIEKESINTICSNTDPTRDYHAR